jgi:glycosyltransferase involved in cell wall biosynthesis
MNILCINYEYPPIGGGAANALGHIARALAGRGHAVHVLTSAFRDLPRAGVEEGVHVFRVPAARRFREKSNPLQMAAFEAAALAASGFLAASRGIDRCLLFFTIPGWASACGFTPGHPLRGLAAGRGRARLRSGLRPFHAILARSGGRPCAGPGPWWPTPGTGGPLGAHGPRARDGHPQRRGRRPVRERSGGGNPGPARRGFFSWAGWRSRKTWISCSRSWPPCAGRPGRPSSCIWPGEAPGTAPARAGHTLGLDRHVVWHGHLDRRRIIALYAESDILVFPSHAEGMPKWSWRPWPAAARSGQRRHGHQRARGPRRDRVSLRPGDSGTFRARLRDLLASPERARRMGLAGRDRGVRDYTWEAVARAYESLLAGP